MQYSEPPNRPSPSKPLSVLHSPGHPAAHPGKCQTRSTETRLSEKVTDYDSSLSEPNCS